jgi:hypothetical protein
VDYRRFIFDIETKEQKYDCPVCMDVTRFLDITKEVNTQPKEGA